jgi:sulfate adenylyltransferase
LKVLFDCTANICRSAYAEVVARHLAGPGSLLVFDSAGTRGFDGEPMNPPMAAEAGLRGADPHGFRSKKLTLSLIDEADLILTAEAAHRRLILEDRPLAMRKAFSLGQFARGLRAAAPGDQASLLTRVREKAATARDDDDIEDPYNRGHRVAQVVSSQIEALLTLILPAL